MLLLQNRVYNRHAEHTWEAHTGLERLLIVETAAAACSELTKFHSWVLATNSSSLHWELFCFASLWAKKLLNTENHSPVGEKYLNAALEFSNVDERRILQKLHTCTRILEGMLHGQGVEIFWPPARIDSLQISWSVMISINHEFGLIICHSLILKQAESVIQNFWSVFYFSVSEGTT